MSTPESSTIEEEIEGETDSLASRGDTERVSFAEDRQDSQDSLSATDRKDSEDSLNMTDRRDSEDSLNTADRRDNKDSLTAKSDSLEKQENEQKEKDMEVGTKGESEQTQDKPKGEEKRVKAEEKREQDGVMDAEIREIDETFATDLQRKTKIEEVEEEANYNQINTVTLEIGETIYAPSEPLTSVFVPTKYLATDESMPESTKDKPGEIMNRTEEKNISDKDSMADDGENKIYNAQSPSQLSSCEPTRQNLNTDNTAPDGTKEKPERITDLIEEKRSEDYNDKDDQSNIFRSQPVSPDIQRHKRESEEEESRPSLSSVGPAKSSLGAENIEPDLSKGTPREIIDVIDAGEAGKGTLAVVDNLEDFYNTNPLLPLSMLAATGQGLDTDNTEFDDMKDKSQIPERFQGTTVSDTADLTNPGQKIIYNTNLKNKLATYGDYEMYQQTALTGNQSFDKDDDDEHIGSVSENDDDEKERMSDDDDFKSDKSFFRTSIFPSLSTPDVSSLYEKPAGMERGPSEELLPSYHDNTSSNTKQSFWPRMEPFSSGPSKKIKPQTPRFSTKAYSFKRATTASTSLPSLRWSYQDLRASDLFEESTDKLVTNIKRLEDSFLRDSEDFSVRGADGSSANIPGRIREIITRNLSSEDSFGLEIMTQPSASGLQEENRLLSQELNRVEDLLSASRAERDELSIKYNALSERLETSLKSDSGLDTTSSEMASRNLVQQNIDLRRKLEEEHASYKRKLQAYQDGQQRQAQLVQKLQAKLLQYKKKCQDLEDTVRTKDIDITRVYSNKSTSENRYQFVDTETSSDLQSVLEQLEEERQRCNGLDHVNKMLREQLDQATSTNQQLTLDIHNLTRDWQTAREELEAKEVEWREEEKSFNEFYNSEHSRLLSLWRAVVTFRRQFGEMKVATERDLSSAKGDMQRAARYMQSACMNFSARTRNDDTQAQVSLERERSEKMSLESQLRDRNRDVHDLQDRINQLTMQNERLKIQLEEKEKAINFIQKSRVQIDQASEDAETDTARHLREETEALHSALRNIAEAVINDADQFIEGEEGGVPRRSTTPTHRASSPTFRASSISPTRSRTPYARLRSPQRSASPITRSRSPAFADATFSAVQAALNKRQLQVSELRIKLNATRDTSTSLKKALEDASNERKRMELVILNLKEDLETVRREKEDSSRDRDRIKNVLNQTGSEKSQLERVRAELNSQIEGLQKDNERLKSANGELQRVRDNLEDEKEDIIKDKDRQVKENERCQRVIEQLEHKMSSIREELVATKEALNRALLDKEVLDGQNREINDTLSRSQLQKAEQEVEINHLRREEAALKDALLKLQALNEGLGQDKIELNRIILQLEAEKASLSGEKSALEQEKSGIREELVRVEQEKMDLDTEKHGLNHTLELSEMSRHQLEQEIAGLTKDKQEVIAQLNVLSRQKHALADELLSGRREVERLQAALERVVREKEMLTQDKGELVVQITACERENRQQGEIIAAYAADKDSLESTLCDTQQHVRELEVRMSQLEGENQELIVKKEHLQSEIARLEKEKQTDLETFERVKEGLNQRLQQQSRDSQLALTKEKQAHEEDVERLMRERESQRVEYDSNREQLIHQYSSEKEELTSRFEQQKEELLQELACLQRDRDDALLVSENDKQQVISLMEQEKATLQERNVSLAADLNQLNLEYDRLKRESQSQQEQNRNNINSLQSELRNIRTQFDETMESHDREVKDLTAQIREISRHREAALREIAELKTQLTVVEETRDTIRRDLIEANRAVREGEEVKEQLRREIVELKRAVGEEVREKDLIGKTADELRNKVKKLEGEKNEMNRVIQDARQRIGVLNEQKAGVQQEAAELRNNLREVEKARLEARRELQDLRRQVKMLDGERSKLDKEVTELQTRVAKDEEKEEEARKTSFDLKQKVVETEASREALRKDLANLQRKMAELIDEARLKERDYQLALEDSRRSERKLEDNRRNLEISLENSNTEAADLRLKLSGTEGRVSALEAALARLDSIKRELEFKLSSIVSTLRRTVGFRLDRPRSKSPGILKSRSPSPRRSRPTSPSKGFDNTYATTTDGRGSPIPRTGSPLRNGSPFRSRNRSSSPGRVDCTDVDIEAVRAALRDFVSQLASAERARDDALSQVRSLTTQLKDLEDERERVENRLRILQKSLGEAEEGKRDIDGRLASTQTALMLQEETICRNERERAALTDKVMGLERSIASGETEKRQLQETISKLKQNESKLEEDKKQMRASLDEAENRCTKIELNRRALEGELQRSRLAINDRETENQVLQDRTENLIRQIQDLESKSQSLQLTIDRLNLNLAKTEEEGHKTKDKVQALNLSLSDSNAMINDLEETVTKLQRGLTASEHDRRVLQERLDATRQALNEAKKQNHTLMERLQVVQHDMAATEVRCSELEGQMKQANNLLEQRKESEKELNTHLQRVCADKQALQERMASMSRTLNSMENEKREIERSTMRLEKDKTALRKTLDKVEREKLQSEEFAHKSIYNRDNVDRTLSRLEEDNISLQRQLQEMQAALAEAEQTHAQRLIDLTTRHRAETEMETERLRSAQQQAERLLEAREKAHRQKVKGLEEQNALLKDQIAQELRKRQQYISKSVRAGDEIRDLRSVLDNSLTTVIRDSNLDPILLEHETRKLEESLIYKHPGTPRRRSPLRVPSPGRIGGYTSTPQFHSGPRSPILRRKIKQ